MSQASHLAMLLAKQSCRKFVEDRPKQTNVSRTHCLKLYNQTSVIIKIPKHIGVGTQQPCSDCGIDWHFHFDIQNSYKPDYERQEYITHTSQTFKIFMHICGKVKYKVNKCSHLIAATGPTQTLQQLPESPPLARRLGKVNLQTV